jgi:hypothetical protein
LESHVGPHLQSVGFSHAFDFPNEDAVYHIVNAATDTNLYAGPMNGPLNMAIKHQAPQGKAAEVRCMIFGRILKQDLC